MTDLSADIDKLVREVVARLSRSTPERADAGSPPVEPSPTSARQETSAPSAPVESDGQLVIASRVVTMAELHQRLEGIQRLVVPPQAVITPSVKDELQRRNVTLAFDQAATGSGRASGLRLVLTVLNGDFDPAPLLSPLEAEPIDVSVNRSDRLVAATDQLAGELGNPNTLAVLISSRPAAALCLVNRRRGVRAVWGVDAGRLAGDAASVGANLLVLDPKVTSLFQLKQMVIQFCRRGPAECPKNLRERLA